MRSQSETRAIAAATKFLCRLLIPSYQIGRLTKEFEDYCVLNDVSLEILDRHIEIKEHTVMLYGNNRERIREVIIYAFGLLCEDGRTVFRILMRGKDAAHVSVHTLRDRAQTDIHLTLNAAEALMFAIVDDHVVELLGDKTAVLTALHNIANIVIAESLDQATIDSLKKQVYTGDPCEFANFLRVHPSIKSGH